MNVPEASSPEYEYCSRCVPGVGCFVYNERWDVCKEFGCLWWHQTQIPDSLRPDRIGVMFEVTTSPALMLAYVDPERPNAWKAPAAKRMIAKIVQAGYSVVLTRGKGMGNLHFLASGHSLNQVIQAVFNLPERQVDGSSIVHN